MQTNVLTTDPRVLSDSSRESQACSHGDQPERRGPTNISLLRTWARWEVGFIFQSFNLIGDLCVAENVDLPLSYLGIPMSERRDRVMEALDRFNLGEFASRHPSELSGGHQQRVAVARAVVGRPEILLADEPTGNLNFP